MVSLSRLRSGRYSISSILATVLCSFAVFSNLWALAFSRCSNSLLVVSNSTSINGTCCMDGEEKASINPREMLSAPSCSKFITSCFSLSVIGNLLHRVRNRGLQDPAPPDLPVDASPQRGRWHPSGSWQLH